MPLDGSYSDGAVGGVILSPPSEVSGPLAPVILLDPDNLWTHMQAQVIEIANKKFGPLFIPNLVKPCRNADEALQVLLQFCIDPNGWYLENDIPEQSVQTARNKSRRIRMETLFQDYIEVFDTANSKLCQ